MTARPLNWNGTGTYECKDGRWIQFNASNSQNARFLTWLVNAAGMDDWYSQGVLDYEGVRRSPELLQKLKPATAKGNYIRSITLSTTHGPGIKIDPLSAVKVAAV